MICNHYLNRSTLTLLLAKVALITACSISLLSCSSGSKSESNENSSKTEGVANSKSSSKGSGFSEYYNALVEITTYDNKRVLEQCTGFMLDKTTLVSIYDPFSVATRATVKPYGSSSEIEVTNFKAVDRINNIITLEVSGVECTPVVLSDSIANQGDKLYTLSKMRSKKSKRLKLNRGVKEDEVNTGGARLNSITNVIFPKSCGTAIFNTNREVVGVALQKIIQFQRGYYYISNKFIKKIYSPESQESYPLSSLGEVSSNKSSINSSIKGIKFETNYGAISIRLYNSMPQYRDNFIKLVEEGYYDSLLIHRVIEGFVIQGGAADSRYSQKGDQVGWKGPGYTLPANINKSQFHRRGVIGAPRLPDSRNSKRRSNGSQFYIVTGRTYNSLELDNIEKSNLEKGINYKFTPEQRRVYSLEGGAPTLDGTYTIFGEVISGIDIADKINRVQVDEEWRPLEDIRIEGVSIIK